MCGIVGYTGKEHAESILLGCLKKLEYRGYDSAGISVTNDSIHTYKKAGEICELEKIIPENLNSKTGIGHTRWATHGIPDTDNAHPHNSGNISVVHNGIIENYQTLKEELSAQSYIFISETDSEAIAHLMHRNLYGSPGSKTPVTNPLEALCTTVQELEGSYGLAILCECEPDTIFAARMDSPIVVGLGEGENFAASDVTAIIDQTKRVVYLEDGEIAVIRPDEVNFFDKNAKIVHKNETIIEWDAEAAEKAGYDHFMLKEIHEQTTSIQNAFAGRISEIEGSVKFENLKLTRKDIQNISRIQIIACGTSWNAGLMSKYLFEQLAGIHTDVDIASEFRYGYPVLCGDTLTVAITQSGETADTLAAVRGAKSYGCRTLAITNVVGSTITREVNETIYTRSGPEIGVAATKTFTGQLIALYLLALHSGRMRGNIGHEDMKNILISLKKIPGQVQRILNNRDKVHRCASMFSDTDSYFFIGRYLNYPVALEAALKLKEISYIYAEGYAAGELKHGPLALIKEGTPVVAIATGGHTYSKMLNNIKEIKARGATVIAIADEDDQEIQKYADIIIPVPKTHELLSPVLSTIILQLLAYYTALERGCSIDKPRNLAKSVTVE